MERIAWTDERLDDFSQRVEARFDRVDSELLELRREMRAEFASVRGEIAALRVMMVRVSIGFGGGIMAGLIGVIATLLVRGG